MNRTTYLEDLKIVLRTESVWLFRDFLDKWASDLGRLGPVVQSKSEDELIILMEEVGLAMSAGSKNQLALQLCSPWMLNG